MTETYFFDLDGTLCDSKPGLVLALNASFKVLDITPQIDPAHFLGAQLPEIFRALKPEITEAEITKGTVVFREALMTKGIFMSPMFPGAMGILMALHEKGRKIWLATAKPRDQALKVLSDLRVLERFDGVSGANSEESESKDKILARAVAESGADPKTSIMTGDRMYDVKAALANGIQPVGALWGYGSRSELEEAGCRDFATDLTDFAKHFI